MAVRQTACGTVMTHRAVHSEAKRCEVSLVTSLVAIGTSGMKSFAVINNAAVNTRPLLTFMSNFYLDSRQSLPKDLTL